MTNTDDRMLAALAAEFPGWHVWRSRDSRGRDSGWNATRRAKGRRGALSGDALARLAAESPAALRCQLEQQRAVDTPTAQAA